MYNQDIYWDIIAWKRIQKFIFKFQRKIYSAALLQEYSRVDFLQTKFINSKILRIWVIQQLIIKKHLKFNRVQIYLFYSKFFSHNKYRPKIQKKILWKYCNLLILKLLAKPSCDAKIRSNQHGFKYYDSSQQMAKKIQNIILQDKSDYILNINLDKKVVNINYQIILNTITQNTYLKKIAKQSLRDGVLEKYQYWMHYYYFIKQQNEPLQIELANLLINAVLNKFSKILFNYNQQKSFFLSSVIHKYYYLRHLYNFTIISKDYKSILEIKYLLVYWLKKIGITLDQSTISIQRTDSGFNTLHFFFKQTIINNKITCVVIPSNKARNDLMVLINQVTRKARNSTLHNYISLLSIILQYWKKYFGMCTQKQIFYELDHQIFQKIRAWVFRRHPNWSRKDIVKRYFPKTNGIKYKKRIYNGIWVLGELLQEKNKAPLFLDKLRWKFSPDLNNNNCNPELYSSHYLYFSHLK
uniref:putative reverse transcriptase/maturase n=1 Tax=Rhodaphanes brevistipitata TaxID=446136 RepID=UPI001FCE0924|nr:putative reverse transcriptase/maturase [Rhodaphanes brevistipitata]UNJ18568.1 putative reverse transcriptase/maturase [Rhodaphanes brevistipitata]